MDDRELHLVVYPAVDAERLDALRHAYDGLRVTNAGSEPEAASAIASADAFFGKLTPGLLQAATRLRWVQAPTASLEHYMFPEFVSHDAVLTNMRGIHSAPIADQVMGYILCFARNLHVYIRQEDEGLWKPVGGESERSSYVSGPGKVTALDRATTDLDGAVLGVVGLGSIGRDVARRARAFSMRVLAVDPRLGGTQQPDTETVYGLEELDTMLGLCDFVAICAPHTPRTVHMFNAELLAQLKPSCILVNVGRGVLVDLTALTAALEAGRLRGAALDVFEEEPLPKESPLWRRQDVLITPHVAGYGPGVAARFEQVVVENIRRFALNQPLLNVVSKPNWY